MLIRATDSKGLDIMTWFQYMTSDVQFKEKDNEYELAYTVGEALEKGFPLTDKQKTYPANLRIITHLEGYDTVGFSVQPFEKYSVDMRDTDKQYCAFMWYISTKQQAEGLLHYLQDHMQQSNEVELWHLFQGPHTNKPYEIETKTTIVSFEELTTEILYELYHNCEDAPSCLIVQK